MMLKKLRENKSLFETFSKSAIYMALRILGAVLAYAFAYFTVKFYDESTYGFVTLAFTILIISSSVFALGFDINLTKIFAEKDSIARHTSKYYTSVLVTLLVSSIFCGGLFLFSDRIAVLIFNKPEFSEYVQWTALTIPLWSLILMTTGVFRGLKNILLYSLFNTFGRFFLGLSVLVILYYGFTDYSSNKLTPVIAHFIALIILFMISLVFIYKKINFAKPRINIDFKIYLRSSFPILISATLIMILTWIDKLYLGIFMDEEIVGIYDIAARISLLIGFSLDAINSILTPKISAAYYDNNLKEMQGEIDTISIVNTLISFSVFGGILIFNDVIFRFIGEKFLIGKTVLIIICIAQLVNSFTGPVWNIMQMTGKQKILSKILGVTLGLNIILNYILIKWLGMEGVAITTAFCFILWNILASYFIYRDLGIRTFFVPVFIRNLW